MTRYWGYRIDRDYRDWFLEQLKQGILRQGWGYEEGQNLRILSVDKGASGNLRMLTVKKGDILLVPSLPNSDEVAVVVATEDWDKGYTFEIAEMEDGKRDYGHKFPAKLIKSFKRDSSIVKGGIRSSLHCISRFWNMDGKANEINEILNADDKILGVSQTLRDRFVSSIDNTFYSLFDTDKFSEQLKETFDKQFNSAEWESPLVDGLKLLYPEPFFYVEHIGGHSEYQHGQDISISFSDPLSEKVYIIAIQVKNYTGIVDEKKLLDQINKADTYWEGDNLQLLRKIVVITGAKEEDNKEMIEHNPNITFIFANRLKEILLEIALKHLGKKNFSFK